MESNEIREMKHNWRMYQKKSTELIEIIEQIRSDHSILKGLDIFKLLPNLNEFSGKLISRLESIEGLLAGSMTDRFSEKLSLTLDKNTSKTLKNFQKAALSLTHSHFQELESVTRELFDTICNLKNNKCTEVKVDSFNSAKPVSVIDPDRLAYAVRVMMIMFIAFLSVIYINDIPGGYTIVTLSAVFGMFISTMPQLSVWILLKPVLLSISFAGVVYVFLMPHLSSFAQLSPLIFGVTFIICYLFSSPNQMLGRVFGLVMFIVITGIDNNQSYSILTVTNTALMFPLTFVIIAITAYVPILWLSEHVFYRLLMRYFSSSTQILSTIFDKPSAKTSYLASYKKSFHLNEITKIPVKLNPWIRIISKQTKTDVTVEQLRSLIHSTETLTLRIKELLRVCKIASSFKLEQDIQKDVQEWCKRIQSTMNNLSNDPVGENSENLRAKLDRILDHFENHIEDSLINIDTSKINIHDGKNFYRLLGAFRNVSDALVNYVSTCETINCDRWHEEQFA